MKQPPAYNSRGQQASQSEKYSEKCGHGCRAGFVLALLESIAFAVAFLDADTLGEPVSRSEPATRSMPEWPGCRSIKFPGGE